MQMLSNNLSCNIRNSKPCSTPHPPPATPPKPDLGNPTLNVISPVNMKCTFPHSHNLTFPLSPREFLLEKGGRAITVLGQDSVQHGVAHDHQRHARPRDPR